MKEFLPDKTDIRFRVMYTGMAGMEGFVTFVAATMMSFLMSTATTPKNRENLCLKYQNVLCCV